MNNSNKIHQNKYPPYKISQIETISQNIIKETIIIKKSATHYKGINKIKSIDPKYAMKINTIIQNVLQFYINNNGISNPNKIETEIKTIVNNNNLVTVCQEANCPNITECWSKRHATFMIMGDTCTRACAFCDVKTGIPKIVDPLEPQRVATAVKDLELKHVVITSVDRDDLDDGGATHFKNVILAIKKINPKTLGQALRIDGITPAAAIIILGHIKKSRYKKSA